MILATINTSINLNTILIALIGAGGAYLAARLAQVHTLVNSNLATVERNLDVALARIGTLETALARAKLLPAESDRRVAPDEAWPGRLERRRR